MIDDKDGFEVLKEIGSQKIHEDTHIPKEHTRGLVDASFSNMNKIQFLGFISILEREYSINLDTLKEKGLEYFEDNTIEYTIAKKVFVASPKKKSFSKFYVIAAVILFVLVVISNMAPSKKQSIETVLDNTNIENATESIAPKIEQVIIAEEIKKEEKRLAATFKILPKVNLWVGYIDLDSGRKYQKTFDDELALDPNGHWLLTLGHGNVDIDINGELKQYQTSRNLKFEYKDGVLKKIYSAEFMRLNKGEMW